MEISREEIVNSKAYQVSKAALKYYNEHYQDNELVYVMLLRPVLNGMRYLW